MHYDLGDAAQWEFVFPTMDKAVLAIPSIDEAGLDLEDDEVRYTKKFHTVSVFYAT